MAQFLASFTQRTIRTDEVNIHFSKAWADTDLRSYVERIACSVLVVSGELDPVMPVTLADKLPEALGDRLWRFDLLPDCGHLVGRDQPEHLHDAIAEFVRAVADHQPSQTPVRARAD